MTEDLQEDPKRASIAAAAINVFSARGFARTSMANIANEAGMSRPALYQYFQNKGDIFGYAFTALVEDAANDALSALELDGSVADQLDGFLQNFDGAFWERTSASPYGDELLSAKSEYAPRAVGTVMARIRRGLETYLKKVGPPGRSAAIRERRQGWIDMLEYAPRGFKLDRPSINLYRQRLSALAKSIAADCEMKLRSA
ncbi:MAG: helix-turn-helix domain containing protein [Myxococcota bacterium]|nr:helix-turn-helix domain containing protein [Myxococcota bacterium]